MENASKALIIAGGILLAIATLSFGVYIFSLIANNTSNIYDELEESSITEFNQNFLNYDGKDDLTIQDVVSIVNLAKYNNKEGKMPVEVIVKVDDEEWQSKNQEELYDEIENRLKDKFSCSIKAYENKLVNKIEITKNS